MELFKRLPMLRWRPKPERPFIPLENEADFPELVADFALLNSELMPSFYALDADALRAQNQFRLEQMVLLVGSALAAILGAVQIALINSVVPGIVETLVTILLAAITYRVRAFNAQKLYFTNRLAAETLRSEYYLFLGRIGIYSDEQNRHLNLISNVARIAGHGYGGVR
jgi:hypothetical protein